MTGALPLPDWPHPPPSVQQQSDRAARLASRQSRQPAASALAQAIVCGVTRHHNTLHWHYLLSHRHPRNRDRGNRADVVGAPASASHSGLAHVCRSVLSRVLDGGARAPSPITLFVGASPQGRNSLPRRLASRMPPRSSTPTTHHRALMTYQWLAAELEPGRPHPIPLLESAARSFWLAQ